VLPRRWVVERTFSGSTRTGCAKTIGDYVRAAKGWICCRDSPHDEAIDPPLRPFHTASPGISVNWPFMYLRPTCKSENSNKTPILRVRQPPTSESIPSKDYRSKEGFPRIIVRREDLGSFSPTYRGRCQKLRSAGVREESGYIHLLWGARRWLS
jgi:hypothetical protein